MDPFIPILKNLKLSKAEGHVLERFEEAPTSRMFLPVAEILRYHNLRDEALEILMRGVAQHPRYTAARVILARELLQKGMAREAWQTLEDTVDSLSENVLAQKLKFKLAIALGKEFEAREVLAHMRRREMLDQELKDLGEALQVVKFQKLKEQYRRDLRQAGIKLDDGGAQSPDETRIDKIIEPKSPLAYTAATLHYDEPFLDQLKSYQTVALADFARLGQEADGLQSSVEPSGLDSVTLAEVFENQRFYQKALDIYRRLLEKSPRHEWLKEKVNSLTALAAAEAPPQVEGAVAEAVDLMYDTGEIDRKVSFLNELLRVLH